MGSKVAANGSVPRLVNVGHGNVVLAHQIVAIVALDSLPVKRLIESAKGSPKLWGLHNYGDVNRRRTTYTRKMLRSVPGEVWLTETGGIVKLLPSFKRSPSRAKARTKGMFKLVNRYDTRRRGMRSKITRLFVYTFYGEDSKARFDAGLVNPDGTPRPAFSIFKKNARKHR